MKRPAPSPAAAPEQPLTRAQAQLGATAQELERRLSETYRSTVALIPEVSRHLIGSGGKRIRPLMLLLSAEAAGARAEAGLDLAVAVELLHNATLLHDDVVDRGELRRGVQAAPRVYGNSASVLVGDFLLSRSLELVVTHGELELLREFSRMLAAMAEGEVLQLVRSGRRTLDLPDYAEIISGKTAGLFSFACRSGASLAAVPARTQAAAAFGQAFGMAFQIADDVLDYTALPSQSGKDLANDLQQGKATLPLLLACEREPGLLPEVERLAESPEAAGCAALAARVRATDALPRALDEARRHARAARAELAGLPAGEARATLEALAEFAVERVELTSV
ncbi:MAG TPA: polyprenyl synthetase family protein [Myxococcota bacterium]|nr:polyprenyl synthetase family protein [Myxococcota bacterium]HRY94712.1 polyprenyl synthetase family protein [Myxococcota bacterium]HSA21298.1 polyprenyl synthetase family protein [Myxococcota bacterium]